MPSVTLGDATAVELIVHLYGASLGSGWSGMPARMAPDYVNTSPLEKLDLTLPVYIDWEIPTYYGPGGCAECAAPNPTPVVPPRPLANEAWFAGHSNSFVPIIVQDLSDAKDYTTCAMAGGLEEPLTSPLTSDGRMRVADIHGGISDDTTIYWVRVQCFGSVCEYWVFVTRWNRVQTYTDVDTQTPLHATPGQVVTQTNAARFTRNCSQPCIISNIWSQTFVTQWVSTDASQASPRAVDSSDLSALAANLGKPIVWGYDPPVGTGPASRTYHVNFAPFDDVIDSGDISAFASDIGKTCGLAPKSTAESHREALMRWFGFAPTGRDIVVVPGQPAVPEWALVDAEQKERAIQDPDGYLRRINAQPGVPWGRVKGLYR